MTQIAISRLFRVRALCFLTAIPTVFCSAALGAAHFSITANGKPRTEILVESAQAEPIAFAAQELQRYVKEISGAELPIVRAASEKPAIVLISRPLEKDKRALEDPREEDHY